MLIMYAGCKPDPADCAVQEGTPPPHPSTAPCSHAYVQRSHRKIITYCGLNGSVKSMQQASQCVYYTTVELLRSMLL